MAGVLATGQMHKFIVIITVGTMLALSYLQLSEFTIFNIGFGLIMQSSATHYFNTRKAHPDRRFLPHSDVDSRLYQFELWMFRLVWRDCANVCQLEFTAGWTFAAAVVLPLATASGETGCIITARRAYNYLVHSKKVTGQGHLAGDQLFIPGPGIVMGAHSAAESCRLATTFAGAVLSGGYSWVPTSCLSLLLNISARLRWSALS